MSSRITSRPLLRRARLLAQQHTRRYASATEAASNAAASSKEAASNATSKAAQGLSRVQSAAGPAVSGVVSGIQTRVANISGRAGRLISFVESMIPPTMYYSKVGWEFAKITFHAQKMSPPSAAAFQKYGTMVFDIVRNPRSLQHLLIGGAESTTSTATPRDVLTRIRNASNKEIVAAGVIGAEVLGFFTVGEMIGKFKIIGYRGDPHVGSH